MVQGFYIGRPMRGDLVPEWMTHYAAGAMSRTAVVHRLPEKVEKVRRQ
jgi:hypothetical protein